MTVLLSEFIVLLLKAPRKLFWFDELVTFYVSSLRPFHLLFRALQAGADQMTPLYYIIVVLGRMLPGDPLVTLRLPSILGYLLTLLGVYWFVTKRLPISAGFVAILLIALSPLRYYALEGRPYALTVGFLAISAATWQRIGHSRFMTPLFATSLTLAVASHHLAVLAILPFAIAELFWSLLSRRIRGGVWVAYLLASCPFFATLPILLHYRDVYGKHFFSPSGWRLAGTTYGYYLGIDYKFAVILIILFTLAAGAMLLRAIRHPTEISEHGFKPYEIVLVGAFLLYPALLVVLTKLLGAGYHPRYGWPGILGLVLASVYLGRTVWSKSAPGYVLTASLVVFAMGAADDLHGAYDEMPARTNGRWANLAELSRSKPAIPIVIASPLAYLQAVKYAPPELRDRLVDVVDIANSVRVLGTDSADATIRLLAQFVPMRVEERERFLATNRQFLLRSGGVYDWFTQYLLDEGYRLNLIAADPASALYVVERQETIPANWHSALSEPWPAGL
jgi:hypothetical protein